MFLYSSLCRARTILATGGIKNTVIEETALQKASENSMGRNAIMYKKLTVLLQIETISVL